MTSAHTPLVFIVSAPSGSGKSTLVNELLKAIPMQRTGTVDEVAAVVSFLISPDASYITRQVIDVNGGLY